MLALRPFGRRLERSREIAAPRVWDLAVERRRKLPRGVADQEGMPQAREVRRERGDPSCLGKAAGNPVDRRVARERLFGRIGVRSLRIIDIAYALNRIYQFLTMSQAREGSDAGNGRIGRQTGLARDRVSGGGVLCVVPTGEPRRLGKIKNPPRRTFQRID